MDTIATALRVAAGIAAVLLWFSYDKLTPVQVMWCVGLIVASIVWYTVSCWWWPFGMCFCCKGKGSHFRGDGKVFRTCRKRLCTWHSPFAGCGGVGRKLRWGRRIFNFVQRHTAGAS